MLTCCAGYSGKQNRFQRTTPLSYTDLTFLGLAPSLDARQLVEFSQLLLRETLHYRPVSKGTITETPADQVKHIIALLDVRPDQFETVLSSVEVMQWRVLAEPVVCGHGNGQHALQLQALYCCIGLLF